MPDLATILSGLASGSALPNSGQLSQQGFLKPYLGQIATASKINSAWTNSNKFQMVRSPHIMRDPQPAKVVFHNGYWDAASTLQELGSGGTMTVAQAEIEYPAGTTLAALTFAGGQGSTAIDGALIASDFCAAMASIPAGARFWVRYLLNCSNGICFNQVPDAVNGAAMTYTNTAQTYQPAGQPVTDTSNGVYGNSPIAIVGITSKASVLLLGDSRTEGAKDTYDSSGDLGETARSIGPFLAYINAGCRGDTLAKFLASYAFRTGLAQFCSHVVCEAGINDCTSGAGVSAIRQNMQLLWQKFANKAVYQITIPPVTTSSDSWATTANQTTHAQNPTRQSINELIRSLPHPLTGYFEVADAVESARNSGLWKPSYTPDGTHENQAAALAIKNAGGINPALILR